MLEPSVSSADHHHWQHHIQLDGAVDHYLLTHLYVDHRKRRWPCTQGAIAAAAAQAPSVGPVLARERFGLLRVVGLRQRHRGHLHRGLRRCCDRAPSQRWELGGG